MADDFDGDGLLDLVNTSWGAADPMERARRRQFETLAAVALDGITGLQLTHADYDNDGTSTSSCCAVRMSSRSLAELILRNDGHGRFTDVGLDVGWPSRCSRRKRRPGATTTTTATSISTSATS